MVERIWWEPDLDDQLVPFCASVLWHCWFGHLACQNHLRNQL